MIMQRWNAWSPHLKHQPGRKDTDLKAKEMIKRGNSTLGRRRSHSKVTDT